MPHSLRDHSRHQSFRGWQRHHRQRRRFPLWSPQVRCSSLGRYTPCKLIHPHLGTPTGYSVYPVLSNGHHGIPWLAI
jgi:hypothetical protein